MTKISNGAFDYFDKIFCINLDTRPDRWEQSKAVFEKVGIADRVERLSGNRGVIPGWENADGCALSHLKAIHYARENKLNNVMIFEDDIILERDTMDDLPDAVRELSKQDWKLFYLGANIELAIGKMLRVGMPARSVGRHLYKVNVPVTCAHAYAVHHTAYDAILNSPYFKLDFDTMTIVDHKTDEHPHIISWDDLLALKIPDKYCLKDFLFLQRVGFSDHLQDVIDQSQNCRDNLAKLEKKMFWWNIRRAVLLEDYWRGN